MNQPLPARAPRVELDGVLLLDKPSGLSSNDALVVAKRLLNAKKAGHTGTLDPLATGLLPLCFGEATKFSADLLDADKRYEAQLQFGATTSTGDAEGEVVATAPIAFGAAQLAAAMRALTGAIDQVPPMHSALKKDGKPLYAYARAGVTVARAARRVTIHHFALLDDTLAENGRIRVDVLCSKGTYIRTLAEDLGQLLGCGAHLTALRRTGVGSLTLAGAVTLDQLEQTPDAERVALLAPVDHLLRALPVVALDAAQTERFGHGQRLPVGAVAPAGLVRVVDGSGRLLGTAELDHGVLHPKRLLKAPI